MFCAKRSFVVAIMAASLITFFGSGAQAQVELDWQLAPSKKYDYAEDSFEFEGTLYEVEVIRGFNGGTDFTTASYATAMIFTRSYQRRTN